MLLGGKGANLCEMAKLSLPVPPAFVITTETCLEYFDEGTGKLPANLEYGFALEVMEKETGKKFGDPTNPLLVSVRSGAPASMPGMMDTVLNLGLNDEIVQVGLALRGSLHAYMCLRASKGVGGGWGQGRGGVCVGRGVRVSVWAWAVWVGG